PDQPVTGKREAGPVEPVEAGAPAALVADQAGGFERLQVAGGGRPGMGEQAGNRAGAQLAAGEMQRDQDPPPRRMGESGEDRLIGVGELAFTHDSYLAPMLNMSQPRCINSSIARMTAAGFSTGPKW